jgi:hypothetical protein
MSQRAADTVDIGGDLGELKDQLLAVTRKISPGKRKAQDARYARAPVRAGAGVGDAAQGCARGDEVGVSVRFRLCHR